ncbi:MAG: hypothetical protein RLY57_440 [Candidatus Parcubacteria bacterium]|jgi:hypothetical protein
MDSIKYLFRRYTLVVRYFGSFSVTQHVCAGVLCGRDIPAQEPILKVFRFWTERGLQAFAERHDVSDFKRESSKVYSCSYYES